MKTLPGSIRHQKARHKRLWWAVRALYVCDVASSRRAKRELVEESLFLIRSSTIPEARRKAEKVAKQAQIKYKNSAGETVRWKLIQVLEFQEIIARKVCDAGEIYFRLYRNTKAAWIIKQLKYRAGSVPITA